MKTTKQLHDEEQAEAELVKVHNTFESTMTKLNRDHDDWVRRNKRNERLWLAAVWTIAIAISLSFIISAVHIRITHGQ